MGAEVVIKESFIDVFFDLVYGGGWARAKRHSHREAEFEGLLQGDNSPTKVISLGRDVPIKREATHSESFASSLGCTRVGDIDFETRLASYSDDGLNTINTNSRKMLKEERRRSKDDAWVDILVASHSRRAGNQDAKH
jgi:hypothetical protein